jgi:hypothetical protein
MKNNAVSEDILAVDQANVALHRLIEQRPNNSEKMELKNVD